MVISTHHLPDLERIVDRVLVLEGGELIHDIDAVDLLVVTSAAVAAGFSISVSYEDWGTAVIWLIGFGLVLGIIGALGVNPVQSLWPALSALAMALLIAVVLVSYARRKAILGQPEWTMTSIIGGTRGR